MSATFRNQVIAGHSIGAGRGLGILLWFITWSLVAVNAYHMTNFLISKLTTPDTAIVVTWALWAAGAGIAALEIPLGKSLVTTYRLHGFTFAVLIQGLMAVVIASMAVFAGVNSQLADSDRRDTQSAAYSVSASSYENMKQSAAMHRDSAIARANRIENADSKQIAILEAKANYQDRLVSIANKEASNTLTKPVQMFASSSDEHYITIMLFSIVCSFGALFCSAFSAIYINPLVSMPAFSLKAKANHDWQSDGSDFQSAKHELSPLANKVTGYLQREKVPAKALPQQSDDSSLTSAGSGTTQKPPTRLDSTSGRIIDTSERSLNDKQKAPAKVEYSQDHYEAIKRAIVSGSIKPIQKAVKRELIALQVAFIDDAARQKKAVEILAKLKSEGVIIDNPKQANTSKILAQYVVNPSYQVQEGKQTEEEVISADDVTVTCPKCLESGVIEKAVLEKSRGKVRCSCGDVYQAKQGVSLAKGAKS